MLQKTMARHAVAGLALTLLLSGCSGEQPDAPRVATLDSAGPTAASPTTGARDDQRPLVRLDATDEERNSLVKVWTDCITKEGGAGYEQPKSLFKYLAEGDAKAKKVQAACASKEPETYEERQKRTDIAAFRDNQRQWYQCAQKQGYKLNRPDENGEFGLTEIGPDGDFASPKIEKCRKDAFKD